jgi:hypothetical protein
MAGSVAALVLLALLATAAAQAVTTRTCCRNSRARQTLSLVAERSLGKLTKDKQRLEASGVAFQPHSRTFHVVLDNIPDAVIAVRCKSTGGRLDVNPCDREF